MYIDNVTRRVGVTVGLQACIQEVCGSSLGQDTDCPEGFLGFPQSLSVIPGAARRFSHDHLLLNPFQLVLVSNLIEILVAGCGVH
jgi:hypothetical protein